MAVMEVEGALTLIASCPVALAPPLGTVTLRGEQLTPGKVAPQVIATLPVNPPVGVSVIAELPLLPAVTVAAAPARAKEPLLVTVTVIAGAEDSA
jgi:hypothetical protein